jgi:hypothetical protein
MIVAFIIFPVFIGLPIFYYVIRRTRIRQQMKRDRLKYKEDEIISNL